MKVSASVRGVYDEIKPLYEGLREIVDRFVVNNKSPRWHYESRVKEIQSYALKLESGRVENPRRLEDFFAATIVVENYSKIKEAEELLVGKFSLSYKRPKVTGETHMNPQQFDFDDLRLYLMIKPDSSRPATGFEGVVFELQIKTFLQHAWGIATHDLIYKSDEVAWSESRVAYQVKALLESAEVSINQVKAISDTPILKKENKIFKIKSSVISKIKEEWRSEALPADVSRLAQNIIDLASAFGLRDMDEVWVSVDWCVANSDSKSKDVNISPYAFILKSLILHRGIAVFDYLKKYRGTVYVPVEIDVGELDSAIKEKIVRL